MTIGAAELEARRGMHGRAVDGRMAARAAPAGFLGFVFCLPQDSLRGLPSFLSAILRPADGNNGKQPKTAECCQGHQRREARIVVAASFHCRFLTTKDTKNTKAKNLTADDANSADSQRFDA